MTVKLEDRPREQVKEEVIDTLIHNYSHGFISNEAFERRLDKVIAATSNQAMLDEIEDLSDAPDDTIKQHKQKQFSVNYANNEVEESENMISVLSETDRSGVWEVPKLIKVYSILGSAKIDFTDARFSSPNVRIKIISFMGSERIFVPENVNIVSKAVCVLGSVKNRAASIAPSQAPTITVEGVIILSDLTIKIRTTVKEKFIAFANQMKEMFDPNKM
ncbi:LiaF domain-containing protein [Glaciecola petra]|uniref:LiaF-related protein n=1 Tax=Glaciecola petra TaxID=3075602 RepID=A0ABU2ZR64_9ALTE|nr:LiaF domain-containing protein [Aestuariibacter sp. P117]MDT0595126.1 LiaF-related protein [Aestuariibacter sp. P117]